MAKEAFCSALSKKGVPLCYEQSIRMHENIYIYIYYPRKSTNFDNHNLFIAFIQF